MNILHDERVDGELHAVDRAEFLRLLQQALDRLGEWGRQPLPLSAASHHDNTLCLRLEGNSALARDLVEVLRAEPLEALELCVEQTVAFHWCTLQHAQQLGGAVEAVLQRLGFSLTAVPEGHLCCGSAGTYSLTQPALSKQLRDNRLDALESGHPQVIATANVGCQTHLDGAGRTPVRHWIELVDSTML